jgi:hypothetical protein
LVPGATQEEEEVADVYGRIVSTQSTWELLPRGILAVAPLAGSLAATDALCRLACNLGAGAGDAGGGDAAAEGRRRWDAALGDCIRALGGADAAALSARQGQHTPPLLISNLT